MYGNCTRGRGGADAQHPRVGVRVNAKGYGMVERPYFLKELLRAKKEKVMVSVYFSDEDSDACATGYVSDATNDGITLEHFTPYGAPDGKVLIRMNHLFMVDVDGRYERKIAFLADHYDKVFPRGT